MPSTEKGNTSQFQAMFRAFDIVNSILTGSPQIYSSY